MPWLALLTNRWTYVIAAFALCCAALGIQTTRLKWVQAEYATFQAAVAKEAADAKVRNAQIAAGQAQAAQEVLDDLQTRHAALGARYASLRASAGSRTVSAIPGASGQSSACPGSASESDTLTRCLAATEWGDRELAKYAELWKLWRQNAKSN